MLTTLLPLAAAAALALPPADSTARPATVQPPPVIDMHLHALPGAAMAAMLAAMDTLNVRHAVYIATESGLAALPDAPAGRLLPALMLPCDSGRAPTGGARCFADGAEFPDVARLRRAAARGEVKLLGEVTAQYMGVAIDDPRMEPYFALAEELDLPVGIHLGTAIPGAAYAGGRFPPHKSPRYRGAAGDPLRLEDVLLRHPRLRVYVMHAAWPFEDAMLYMLSMHPQLHVDVAVLQYALPRPEYHRYLRRLVEAGFGKRVMFGSDGSAQRLREGVAAIMEAEFLSAEQRRDILHDNAARFLRLDGAAGAAR